MNTSDLSTDNMPATTTTNRIDAAIDVLRLTNDGNDLAPSDLALVEAATNHLLTDAGLASFDTLHNACINGTYQKPWLFGIEHLTIDHSGYVFWRSQEPAIEHYTFYDEGSHERLKASAQHLASTCLLLETRGISHPTFSDYINTIREAQP